MERTLQVLNRLEQDGTITRYAIGETMGATFYTEPQTTFDLDIFVVVPQTSSGLLTLSPLYESLGSAGYPEEGECINIEGVPVQFLPAYNALLLEALGAAATMMYDATPARVFRAEHLLAVALQTGRPKDRERVRLLRDQAALDVAYLAEILQRHNLGERWHDWTR